jgi:hypothetical protein
MSSCSERQILEAYGCLDWVAIKSVTQVCHLLKAFSERLLLDAKESQARPRARLPSLACRRFHH